MTIYASVWPLGKQIRNFKKKKISFGFSFQNFGISYRSFGFSTRNFEFSNRPTKISGVNFGILCYRNFRSAKKYEVSNEVSVERKPEKFTKFQAKMNYYVHVYVFLMFTEFGYPAPLGCIIALFGITENYRFYIKIYRAFAT
jgi:hypothetical protein